MNPKKIYDIIGIGIGPFNLGLAALCFTIPELQCLFIDQNDGFNWHPGLMIEGSRLQVPFYADLVSLADPSNPFSYMAYLKAMKRMFRFAICEKYSITRWEYNDYGKWVTAQLPSLIWNQTCKTIKKASDHYVVTTNKQEFFAKQIVLGTGTVPSVPACAEPLLSPLHRRGRGRSVFHSANYLYKKEQLLRSKSVTIIGSGQSAAEIFYDLLQQRKYFTGGLNWITRSERFKPMDYSKLTLEMSTPDYIDHFHALPPAVQSAVLNSQADLYKGINRELIDAIYETLYHQDLEGDANPVTLQTNCELINIETTNKKITATFLQKEINQSFQIGSDAMILATGYKEQLPSCIHELKDIIQLTPEGGYNANVNYAVDNNNSIFIQNAEMKTHGFNAPNLSLGPYRNGIIINTILGREQYTTENNITFQTFGLP